MNCSPSQIVVRDRFRSHTATAIQVMADSIKDIGQLQPVIINSKSELIDGERRLRACEFLGINVLVRKVETLDDACKAIKAQRDANNGIAWSPVEMVRIGKELEKFEVPAAADRKAATQTEPGNNLRSNGAGKFPSPLNQEEKGRSSDKVAAAFGVSGRTYEKAKAVVAAAEAPDAAPEIVAAKEEMDRTGKVDPAFKTVTRWEQGASQLPKVSDHSEADSESDNLFTLKRTWKKTTKKDRKLFLSWAKENA